jgi:hypothetical protein
VKCGRERRERVGTSDSVINVLAFFFISFLGGFVTKKKRNIIA